MYCRTALHLAVCKQNLHIVDLLLDSDGMAALLMQDDEGNNPLHKVHVIGRLQAYCTCTVSTILNSPKCEHVDTCIHVVVCSQTHQLQGRSSGHVYA